MTLWDLQAMQSAEVIKLADTLSPTVLSRLIEMGLDLGQQVHCLRRGPFNGPVVLELGGSVFALEKSLAQAILVRH